MANSSWSAQWNPPTKLAYPETVPMLGALPVEQQALIKGIIIGLCNSGTQPFYQQAQPARQEKTGA